MYPLLYCVGTRQEEIAAMGGPDEFAEFYRRLKHLKDHHRKYGSEGQTEEPMIMEFMRLEEERKNPPAELQSESCDCHVMRCSHVTITHLQT